jgi:hypothetical protein
MTAINIIKHDDCIHLLTDGAGYDSAGNITFEATKAWPLPNLPAVIAVRGPALLAALMVNLIGSCGVRRYDDLPGKAQEIVIEAEKTHHGLLGLCSFGADFDFVFGGMKSDGTPHAGIVSNHERTGIPAYALIELGDVAILPSNETMATTFRMKFPRAARGVDLDPATDGLEILEMQRREAFQLFDPEEALKIVGGFGQLTSVYADRVETRVLRDWPAAARRERARQCVQ